MKRERGFFNWELKMKRVLVLSGVLIIAGCPAEETPVAPPRPKPAVVRSFVKTFPYAVAEGVLVDAPLYATLWIFDKLSFGAVPVYAAASIAGYSIRKTCNDHINENKNWMVGSVCGLLGGAVKHTSRSGALGRFTKLEPILGGVDAGLYEGTAGIRGDYPTAEILAIEMGLAVFGYGLSSYQKGWTWGGLGKDVKLGAAIGLGVPMFIYTTYAWYAPSVKSWVQYGLSGFGGGSDKKRKQTRSYRKSLFM
jgi:hypothetical protein